MNYNRKNWMLFAIRERWTRKTTHLRKMFFVAECNETSSDDHSHMWSRNTWTYVIRTQPMQSRMSNLVVQPNGLPSGSRRLDRKMLMIEAATASSHNFWGPVCLAVHRTSCWFLPLKPLIAILCSAVEWVILALLSILPCADHWPMSFFSSSLRSCQFTRQSAHIMSDNFSFEHRKVSDNW